MRKIKIVFMAIAVIAAVGSAWAAKPDPYCEDFPQFYKTAYGYAPAGQFGEDFFCWSGPGVCTYYQPDPFNQPNTYLPCHLGTFQPLFLGLKGAAAAKASR